MTCDKLKGKTKTTGQWRQEHQPHLAERQLFTTHPYEFRHQHPDWLWVICPCGARLLTTGPSRLTDGHNQNGEAGSCTKCAAVHLVLQ